MPFAPPPPPRAILVIVEGLRPADAGWLFATGAAAWMNVRTAGPGGGYATLGAGTRLRGPQPRLQPDGRLDMAALAAANRDLPYPAAVGALGTAARRAGDCTAAFGGIGAATAIADARGRVDQLDLGPARPAQLQATDCRLIAFEVTRAAAPSFLAHLRPRPQDLVLALGVAPPGSSRLLPAAILQRRPGLELATSATTRQPGLIADTDVAPTLLATLGLPPPADAVGHVVRLVPGSAAQAERLGTDERANDDRRPWVFRGYVYVETLLVVVATIAALRRRGRPGHRWAVRCMAAVPAGFLVLALAPAAGPAPAGAISLAAAAFLTWCCRDLLGLAAATVGLLCLDLLRGAPWMIASPLGYSFAAGARYYGIGDEYEGVLVGAALVAAGLAHDRLAGRGLPWLLAGLTGVALLIGWPGLGTNFGGLLACGVGCIAFATALGRVDARRLALATAALAAALVGSGAIDAWTSGAAATDLGQTAELVQRTGVGSLWPIALRKLTMNEHLILYTPWSWVLLTSIGCFALLVLRPDSALRRALAGRPGAAAALVSVAAATLANLACQDAGVVAAAMNLVFGSALLLDLFLDGRRPAAECRAPALIGPAADQELAAAQANAPTSRAGPAVPVPLRGGGVERPGD